MPNVRDNRNQKNVYGDTNSSCTNASVPKVQYVRTTSPSSSEQIVSSKRVNIPEELNLTSNGSVHDRQTITEDAALKGSRKVDHGCNLISTESLSPEGSAIYSDDASTHVPKGSDQIEFERIWESMDLGQSATLASSETLSPLSRSQTPSSVTSRPSDKLFSSSLPSGPLTPAVDDCPSLRRGKSFHVYRYSEPCPSVTHINSPQRTAITTSALQVYCIKSNGKGGCVCDAGKYRTADNCVCPPSQRLRRASVHGLPVHSSSEMEVHVHFPKEDDSSNEDDDSRPLNEQQKPMLSSSDVIPGSNSKLDSYKLRQRSRCSFSSGIGEPSVYHALVVIFLEFFAWGLLTSPMIQVLKETFPDHTFLMNGIIMGIKGLLSFLSAPLIGALSDVWGRKFFLFVTVFFTCLPIPFMKIDTWWYFALISMSGVFAVTYSIVFAYVADVTDVGERHYAYGLVSATFAASLVISPALGAYLGKVHSNALVVGLATALSILDIIFILVAVPESLPEKLRLTSTWSNTQISWEQADPFTALVKVCKDRNILLISVTVFLSYLPEAGQLSCFFVYLQLVMDFGPELVATFIAMVGILSVIAQTALLSLLIRSFSNKRVIIIGLVFEMLQLMWYGFGSQRWMMWAAGVLAAISSITYPAISSYVSTHTDIDKQGVVQGIVTGMRGLCAGLGPAVFGFIFYLFHVDLDKESTSNSNLPGAGGVTSVNNSNITGQGGQVSTLSPQIPGPPFVFGAFLVLLALTVSAFIPEKSSPKGRKQPGSDQDIGFSRDHKKNDSIEGISHPLVNETGIL